MHTGSRAFCFLMAIAATGAECASADVLAPGHYRVEAKMISLPAAAAKGFGTSIPLSGIYSNEQVARLIGAPRSSTLSFPSVEAVETAPAQIAVTRSFALPHAASQEVGVTLNVVPAGERSHLKTFSVSLNDVRLAGFEDRGATRPVLDKRSLHMGVTESPHYWCINLPPLRKSWITTYDADGRRSASIADANERQLLFVKITRG
jgi:hypothetical protein